VAQTRDPQPGPGRPTTCEIRLRGHLGQEWADWFEGLTVTLEDGGDTLLSGPVADQAALFGLLKKLRDLGVALLSITWAREGQRAPHPQSAATCNPTRSNTNEGDGL
jgi:hypothetical protein